MTMHDDAASVACAGAGATVTGSGEMGIGGVLVITVSDLTCDDGSQAAVSGPDVGTFTFSYDVESDTITDNFGVLWWREGTEQPSASPAELFAALAEDRDTPDVFAEIGPGSMVDLPDAPIDSRTFGTAVWTGTEMIVWSGIAYDPVTDSWPYLTDGAAFNLANGRWRVIAPGPLRGRQQSAAVWTGTEMIVWGGFIGDDVPAFDGAAYNPASDTWRLLPEIPYHMTAGITISSMVWTGNEAVVLGGAVAAAYDPVTNSWRRLADPPDVGYPAISTGDSIIVASRK